MTTIDLNTVQTQAVLCAINGTLEDYFNEIRRTDADSEAYCSLMDTFEQLAGVKAIIEAQAAQH
ncbi:hypothetical protein [Azonexus sp.]|uniref:hypothetical protein n=1 Tax=Azonexus sp. TaxID=1872668 RepID=UPI0035AF7EBD